MKKGKHMKKENNLLKFIIVVVIPLIGLIIYNISQKEEKTENNIILGCNKTIIDINFLFNRQYEQITSRSNINRQEEEENPIKRNLSLTTTMDLRNISGVTAEEFDKMLKGTKLQGIGKSLEQVEKEYGINGLYIMGLCCLESSYGKSKLAIERNNLVGWNAVDKNTHKAKYFKSKDECILFISKKLKENYLTQGGKYFNGYSAKAIDVRYCSDKEHANKIVKIVNKLTKKL